MSLTNDGLILECPNEVGGVQRIYRFLDGHGLSLINARGAHYFPFAWEAAVLKGVQDNGNFDALDYSSPLTDDVEVFLTDEETNEFIEKARLLFR